ncbi:caspase family protein [Caldimonas sp. KR1-144]|uniref:caspase family protein n=1 Tax=Caldimonas sp. KR1-144 TaxID=3400911 RepID=UPI003C009524
MKPFRILFAACAALLAACSAPPRGEGVPRLALVIGNAAYENAPALKNPANDAADMCAALGRLGFKTLCHANVRDRAEFDARVKEYVEQLGPSSVGVFYFSGHGVQARDANFLIPTQVQPRSVSEDPLRVLYGVDELFDRLRQRPTKFQLVILDACRTDLFAAPRTATSRGAPPAATKSALVRALETDGRAASGLAPIKDAPPSTIVLYATASKDAAYDGDGRNGPLTKHILQHIGTRGVPVEEFIKRVTQGVETETARDYRRRQTPFIYGSFGGTFCFAGCPGAAQVPPSF